MSCSYDCSTDVTGVGNSGDVVGFDVGPCMGQLPLLATHFTEENFTFLVSGITCFSSSFHHGLDLVIQILQVSSHSEVSDSYSSF